MINLKKHVIHKGTIAVNRKARFNYHILDTVEAGLVLKGSEIKSIRAGKVDISAAYARSYNSEFWLIDAHIASYDPASIFNHDPKRHRKLLLHRDQVITLSKESDQKGLTIVPLRLYIRNSVAKIELGLAKGKKIFDKRRTIIEREVSRQVRRSVKR